MPLCESTYATLIVSSSEKFNSTISAALPDIRYTPKITVNSVSEARRAVLEKQFDIVIVNSPLPDEYGTKFAVDMSRSSTVGVMLFVKSENYDEISARVTGFGILVIQKPASMQIVSQSLALLSATRDRLRRMEKKAECLEEKMEEIRIINRAKWLLVEQLKMTEPDAHRYIEKQAMDRCVTRRVIAENILTTYK